MTTRTAKLLAAALVTAISAAPAAMAADIMSTPAYTWRGDSILQGPYKAYAPNPFEIISDYGAVPGYHMPIDKVWKLKNDISAYPQLTTSNTLHAAIFNMGA